MILVDVIMDSGHDIKYNLIVTTWSILLFSPTGGNVYNRNRTTLSDDVSQWSFRHYMVNCNPYQQKTVVLP